MKIRFMKQGETNKLPPEHQEHRDTKGFVNLWTRFKNWKNNPPVVAVSKNKIVGFHAATFNRKTYVNSYYQFVSSEARGKGVGGMMFEFVLNEARARGLNRFKCAARTDGDGDQFYQGFGMDPVSYDKDHNYYDVDITDFDGFDTWVPRLGEPMSPKEKARHKKLKRKFYR